MGHNEQILLKNKILRQYHGSAQCGFETVCKPTTVFLAVRISRHAPCCNACCAMHKLHPQTHCYLPFAAHGLQPMLAARTPMVRSPATLVTRRHASALSFIVLHGIQAAWVRQAGSDRHYTWRQQWSNPPHRARSWASHRSHQKDASAASNYELLCS